IWPLGSAVFAIALALDASAAAPNRVLEADAHFRLGVKRYEESRYDDAIDEFTRAYEASGDYRYLFNLGQAHAVRWKPVEALASFEKYLREGGTRISAQRRALVSESIARQRMRTAQLDLRVRPNGALIRVDGRHAGRSPLPTPILVATGDHVITVTLDGYQTVEQELKLREQDVRVLEFSLAPETSLSSPPPRPRFGRLALDCTLPDIKVFVDNHQLTMASSGGEPVVEEGTHELRIERAGYRTQVEPIRVSVGQLTRVTCDMPIAQPLSPEKAGTLKLQSATAGAILTVDGVSYSSAALVPIGLHTVEVRRFGFVPWRGQVRIGSRETHRLWVSLLPTPEYQEELRSRAQIRRNWSYGLAATGAASLGATLALGLWNNRRHGEWDRENSYLQRQFDAGIYTPELEQRRNEANHLLQSVQSVDIMTAGLAVVSGLTFAGAAVLFFGEKDPTSEDGNATRTSTGHVHRENANGGVWRDTVVSPLWR
ncbi:MAG TPA: PEGA domain-containing protein, partial [Polyangiaceae bacterium]|nr:PEGA domain-containing protein [Polyangiaceae bacterium]